MKEKYLEIITLAAELYSRELSTPAMLIYYELVKDIPLDDFKQIANRLCRTSRYMPTPADFHKEFEGENLEVEDKARLAWAMIRTALGESERPKLDQITKDTLKAVGGWRAIRDITSSNLTRTGYEFVKLYVAKAKAERIKAKALSAGQKEIGG